jgi:hypothetical protein
MPPNCYNKTMKRLRLSRRAAAALVPVILLAAGCTDSSDADTTERDEDGAVVDEGQVGVFRLREGDCVQLPAALRDTGSADGDVTEVDDFEAVPCDELHDGEVVLVDDEFFADLDEFPGDAESATQGNPPCIAALDEYTGTDFESSIFNVVPLVPTSESWDGLDDRGLICIGVTLNDELNAVIDTTGSFRSTG